MKLFVFSILCGICFLCVSAPAVAQEANVVDRNDIDFLIEQNYDAEAIIAYLEDGPRVLNLDLVDLRFMAKKKAPPQLIMWLKKHMPKAAEKFDITAVLESWKKDHNESALLRLVEAKKPGLALSAQATIQLMRAGVPRSIIKALRERKPAPIVPKQSTQALTLDEIVLMANEGKTDEEIIKTIEKNAPVFDVDAAKILELKSDGLSVVVLREIYARRKKTQPPEKKAEKPTSRPTETTTIASAPVLQLYRETGTGISMLRPADFVITKEFQGLKALIQMVAPSEDETGELPDLELSIMVVSPRRKSTTPLKMVDLRPVAASFAQGLKNQFAKDGIVMETEKPQKTWLANRRALMISTQASVTKTHSGYQGASYLMHDKGRIVVVSYSVILEKAHRWRPILQACVKSLVFETPNREAPAQEGSTKREQVMQLFKAWRTAVRQLDFQTYKRIHTGLEDTVQSRQSFLQLARGINEEGKRVEINGIDFEANAINYNVFSVNGMSAFVMPFAKDKKAWFLVHQKK